MLVWLVFILGAKWAAWPSSATAAKEIKEACSDSLVQNRLLAHTRRSQTQEDPQVCSLSVCVFHGPNAPRIWVAEHTDGAGHRMQNIVNGMAVAQKVGMNFGGVLGPRNWQMTDQRVNFTDLAIDFFGATTKDVGGIFAFAEGEEPGFHFRFDHVWELERQRNEINDGTNVMMGVAHEWNWNHSVPSSVFFPVEFRKRLAAPLASWPLLFTPGKIAVAMHLRRGDIGPSDPRATPNEYYYQLADRIHERVPSAEFHVWAACAPSAIQKRNGINYWKNEDFDGFRLKGMQVHLDCGIEDEESVITTWAHLAFANILVSSQSSFSLIPMVLNCRCVISVGSTALDNWIDGTEYWSDSFSSELTACVERSQAPNPC